MPTPKSRPQAYSRTRSALVYAVLAFALCLGLAGPAATQDGAGPEATSGAIEVGSNAVSDAQITQRIRDVLAEIGGFERVRVSVASGVVTLDGEVLDSAAEEELSRIVGRVEGVVTIRNRVDQSAALNERLAPALERLRERVNSVLVNAPIFLVALVVFVVIAAIGWLVTTRISLWQRLAPNSFIAEIYRAVARILFVILGLVVALDILNATALIGAVLGAAGVVGLAVGFAVRDTVENFIASILLSLRQPFRPNDFVSIEGELGRVARLTSRATILISVDGNHIRIPNAAVFKGKIVNFTRDPHRRFTFELGVDADSDLASALTTSVEALQGLLFVLDDPPVAAWIEKVGDSNVILIFAGWINQRETDFLKARGEAIRVVKTALEGAGFGLPEPIYRLRIQETGQPPLLEPSATARQRPVPPTPRPPQDVADLPAAAAPDVVEQGIEEAVDRERSSPEGASDLLSEGRRTE